MDLFEQHEKQPTRLKAILKRYNLEDPDYITLEKMLKAVNKIGYTFDYYLDATPYNLRPLKAKK